MKTVIFVGGASASGKTTLANDLNKEFSNSIKYRRYQGFFDLALKRDIPEEDIFKVVTSDEVDDYFVQVCKNYDVVISDVHYAVQMHRHDNDKCEVDIYDQYVPTISKELIAKLASEDIRIIAIYLSCSPEERLRREFLRQKATNREIRNISIEDATIESIAEESEFKRLLNTNLVEGLELNTELYSKDQLRIECIKQLRKVSLKPYIKIKERND